MKLLECWLSRNSLTKERARATQAREFLFWMAAGNPIPQPGPSSFAQLPARVGDHAPGNEAEQLLRSRLSIVIRCNRFETEPRALIAAASFAGQMSGARTLAPEVSDMHSQALGLVAAARKPSLFGEAFCLDSNKGFDFPRLLQLAASAKVLL